MSSSQVPRLTVEPGESPWPQPPSLADVQPGDILHVEREGAVRAFRVTDVSPPGPDRGKPVTICTVPA